MNVPWIRALNRRGAATAAQSLRRRPRSSPPHVGGHPHSTCPSDAPSAFAVATKCNAPPLPPAVPRQRCPCHARRQFSSLPKKTKGPACPFRTLKIPKDAPYAHAKKSFLKIAMNHHPDTVGNDCEETRQKSQEIFMKCRSALEMLVECESSGKCLLRNEAEEAAASRTMSDEEFDSWFEEETGHQNPFQFDLDPRVMREVASMHDDMAGSHGLDRDGGMWHLASMISSAVKRGKEGAEGVLKLEAGEIVGEEGGEAAGRLDRRRRRVRNRGKRR